MDKPVAIGMLGMGTVGGGVARLLVENGEQITARAGAPLELKRVAVRDPEKPRAVDLPAGTITTDPRAVLDDPEIDIVIELMGQVHPAKDYILTALNQGKSVVTANKEVLAKDGPVLLAEAERCGVDLYFEGSVAGGIPIIKPLRECLAANRIQRIMGIINGTTNYMLTRMSDEGQEFQEVLAEAQAKGYAEADPTADVEGHDAAYKLAILATLAFGTEVDVSQVYCEGIGRVTPEDLRLGAELGYTLKLLAIAREDAGRVEARVHPTFIPRDHPLAAVQDVFNAIFVECDAAGELMFYGRGAGSMPTASAVMGDVVDVVHRRRSGGGARFGAPAARLPLKPMESTVSRFYVSFKVIDRPGVLAGIAAAFGHEDVSIESVIQKGRAEDPVDLVFVTHDVKEKNLRAALDKISLLPVVHRVANVIRVEGAS